jgi:hypothetical protein
MLERRQVVRVIDTQRQRGAACGVRGFGVGRMVTWVTSMDRVGLVSVSTMTLIGLGLWRPISVGTRCIVWSVLISNAHSESDAWEVIGP